MALIHLLLSPWAVPAGLVLLVAYYLLPYFTTYRHFRRIPAPFPAQFTNLWLFYAARRGTRFQYVDAAHRVLGPVVRIQPNHVSIVDEDAIPIIYGHGNGFLKADYYDVFVAARRTGLFNTRDRAEHSRKRKMVSHTFAPKSVTQFEPYIRQNLDMFVKRWDELAARADASGWTPVESLSWFNYVAFDTIGDLAFGAPFGMLENGADVAEVRMSPDAPPTYTSAVETLNRRGEVSGTLGIMPWLKPWAPWIPDPFFSRGINAVNQLTGMAIARVKDRLDNPPDLHRVDLLRRLQEGRDDKGEPLDTEELTAEALTQLIAGSDTTSNSSCALLYHAAVTPGVLPRLQAELDAAIPEGTAVPTFEMVRDLPYLNNVINETLRHHSTAALGLPRLIPPSGGSGGGGGHPGGGGGGVTIRGQYYPPGSVLSVPIYTLHHDRDIWGPDADQFRPDRFDALTPRQKNAFIPFSYGPRACIGRNVAEMEMKMIASTWARRYDVEPRQAGLDTREGFLRKPVECHIGLRSRVRA